MVKSFSMQQGFSLDVTDRTMIVRFTRPEIRNPLSVSVVEELSNVIDGFAADDGLKAVIFTGTGAVFASGADLREIAELTPDRAAEFARRGQYLMSTIANLPHETIAAVNGYCFGGALDLAVACDRRVASPNAKFAHPGAGLGIITGWSGTQRLPRLIGLANSFELFFSASPIDATRALHIGLIDEVAEDALRRALETLR